MIFNSNAHEFFVRSFIVLILAVLPYGASAASTTIVVLGDSLVAGYGLAPGEAFPEKLSIALKDKDIEIINAGVSGDTTAGGLARVDWSVPQGVDGVILELGANDALRGMPPIKSAENLDKIIEKFKARGITVLLVGMKAPPNMGAEYVAAFDGMYPVLAKKHDLLLHPFFLDGVAAQAELNQADGIHPTARGIDVMVEKFLPSALALIERIANK